MTSSSSNPRLICEGQESSETIYDSCHDCNKAFCCNCIDIHFCSGRSQTAGSSAELSTFNMASAETPTITKINLFFTPLASVTNPPPQTKAAFERNKKRAVAELLEEASERTKIHVQSLIHVQRVSSVIVIIETRRLNPCNDFTYHFPSGIPSTEDDRDQVWSTLEKLMTDYWIADFNRLSEEQAYIFQPAAHVQHPTDFDPWGEEDENRVPSGPPSINMNEIRWKVEKELKEYRAVPRLDMRVIVEDGSKGDFIDPLKWWKTHTPSFPT